MSLLPLFDRSLIARADAPALEHETADGSRGNATFGDLEARSNQLAHLLRKRGLKTGDRLAFFLQNRLEVIDLWLAGAKLGLIVVPINVLYRERELTHLLRDAGPVSVVTSHDLADHIPPEYNRWDVESLAAEAAAQPTFRVSEPTQPDTPMALMYTSGTTGPPKGAVLTHGNFAVNASSLVAAWEITPEDRYLGVLPLFHAHGLANGLHCWLFSGCHMRLVRRFEHAKAPLWFEQYQPTLFLGVPAMFIRLLEVPPPQARAIGNRLRLAVSGSAPLPAEVHAKFRALYDSVILERYGMSETLGNTGNPYRGERRVGTVGRPLAHVALKICDESGAETPDGTIGEIWVKGPNVCAGYWHRPDATRAAWRNGWFHTGDLGARSPDGYITLHGRCGDLIVSGGFKIDPREIEQILLEQPGVREASVVGAPDSVRGEVPVAYLVVDAAHYDEAAIDRRLRAQIASFKLPRALVQVDAIPRTALGKVQKHLLPGPRPAR